MKKVLSILGLLILPILWGASMAYIIVSGYEPAGSGTWMISKDKANVGVGFSSNGFWHLYSAPQVDSLFLSVPTQPTTDSSQAATSMRTLQNFANQNAVYFDPTVFSQAGTLNNPYTVKPVTNTWLLAQTGSVSVGSHTNGAGDSTYTVSAGLNLTAVSSDSVKVVVAWTDSHSAPQTVVMQGYKVNLSSGNMGTVRDYALQSVTVRAASGSTITVSTTVSGAGSITYDVGCVIERKN